MGQKRQFMAMMDELELDRVDALRIVMGVSRADVVRQALTGAGLGPLEGTHADRLSRLETLARHEGLDWRVYVRNAVAGQKIMPPLEALEQEAERRLKQKVKAA